MKHPLIATAVAALIAASLPLIAQVPGGNGILPSGTITANDCVSWVSPYFVKDAGSGGCGTTGGANVWTGLQTFNGGLVLPSTTNPTGSNFYFDANGALHYVSPWYDSTLWGAKASGDASRPWLLNGTGSFVTYSAQSGIPVLTVDRQDYFNGGSGLVFGINEATTLGKGVNVKTTANFASGTTNLTTQANANIVAGQAVFGACIPTGDTVASYTTGAPVLTIATACDIQSGTQITFQNLSNNATTVQETGIQGQVASYTSGAAAASSSTDGYAFKFVTSGTIMEGGNYVCHDYTGRESSIAGACVGIESDVVASGPDDNIARIIQDVVFAPSGPSADGATTIGRGIRMRPAGANAQYDGQSGVQMLVGFGAFTMDSQPSGSKGQYGSFGDSFYCDGGESVGCFDIKSGSLSFNPSASNSSGQPNLVFAYGTNINTGQWVSGSANLPASAQVSAVYQCAPTQPIAGCASATNETLVVLNGNLTGTIGTGVPLTFTGAMPDGSSFNGIFTDAFANWINQLNTGTIKAGTALNTASTTVLDICGQGEDSTSTVVCYGDIQYGITTNTHGAIVGTINLVPAGSGQAQVNGSQIATLGVAQTFTAAKRGAVSTLAISTATFTPNFDTNQNFTLTLIHASCPCTFANPSTTPVAGQSGVIEIIQSATGSDTIGTWGSNYISTGGTSTISLSTAANARDYFSYYVADATHIVISAGTLNATH